MYSGYVRITGPKVLRSTIYGFYFKLATLTTHDDHTIDEGDRSILFWDAPVRACFSKLDPRRMGKKARINSEFMKQSPPNPSAFVLFSPVPQTRRLSEDL
jgi:hypothetical protein